MAISDKTWKMMAVFGMTATGLLLLFLAFSYGWFTQPNSKQLSSPAASSSEEGLTQNGQQMLHKPQIKGLSDAAVPTQTPPANPPQTVAVTAPPAIRPVPPTTSVEAAPVYITKEKLDHALEVVAGELSEVKDKINACCQSKQKPVLIGKSKPTAHSTRTKIVMRKPTRRTAARSSVPSKQAVPQGPVMAGSCPGCGQWDPRDQPHQPAPGQVSPRFFDQRIN